MKAALLLFLSCIFITNIAIAGCCSQRSSYNEGGCNPNESRCECTDPACLYPAAYDSDCMSKSKCCEAFGNVGAR